jgi:hypothetical protein
MKEFRKENTVINNGFKYLLIIDKNYSKLESLRHV